MTTGKRIRALSGDGSTDLGEGVLIGEARVFLFHRSSDGSVLSLEDAETIPDQETIDRFLKDGCALFSINTPKIKMDSGQVVYGAQVWWEELDETSDDHKSHAEEVETEQSR